MKRCIDYRTLVMGLIALLVTACAAGPGTTPERAGPDAGVAEPSRELRSEYARALTLMREERYQEASTALSGLTRRYPGLAGPWLNLGIANMELGRDDEARTALLAAAEHNPDNAAVYNLLGVLHREAGRFEDARDTYRQALALDPDYPAAHLNLGILFDLYLQQPDAALAHYQRYLETDPPDVAEVELWIVDLKRRSSRARAQLEGQGL